MLLCAFPDGFKSRSLARDSVERRKLILLVTFAAGARRSARRDPLTRDDNVATSSRSFRLWARDWGTQVQRNQLNAKRKEITVQARSTARRPACAASGAPSRIVARSASLRAV